MNSFPISLASYSFHDAVGKGQVDVFSYLHLLKNRYHVTGADIWTGILKCLDDDYLKAIRATMDKNDIYLANLCVDGPHLWMDTEEERNRHKTDMLRYIEVATILGAKTVRIDFGGKEGTEMHEEGFAYLVKTYGEYCDICGDLGMKIGPENHWGWDKKAANLKKVKEAVNHPAYGQLFHFTGFGEDIAEGTDLSISSAMHTHIPANSIPVAKGLIRKLYDSGYKGTYSVEHHSGHLELERVEWQLGSVRGMIEEIKEEIAAGTGTNTDYFKDIYTGE